MKAAICDICKFVAGGILSALCPALVSGEWQNWTPLHVYGALLGMAVAGAIAVDTVESWGKE